MTQEYLISIYDHLKATSLSALEGMDSIPCVVKLDAVLPTARHRCDVSSEAVLSKCQAAEMGPATRYPLPCNTSSIIKI